MLRTFEQILAEQKKKDTTSLSVAGTMLVAGVVLLIARQALGWLFIVLSLIVGGGLYSRRKSFQAELAKAGGAERLKAQLDSPRAQRFDDFFLILTPDIAVITYPVLKVFRLADMTKFEVGIGEVQKALFLTDQSGRRNKIAETQKGDGRQEAFDRLYEEVRAYFTERRAQD